MKEILNISTGTLNKSTYIEYGSYEIILFKSRNGEKEIFVHVLKIQCF